MRLVTIPGTLKAQVIPAASADRTPQTTLRRVRYTAVAARVHAVRATRHASVTA